MPKSLKQPPPQVQTCLQYQKFNPTNLFSFILQINQNTTTWKVNQHRPGQEERKLNTANNVTTPAVVIINFERVRDLSHNLRNNKIHVAHFQENKQYFTACTPDAYSTSVLGQSPACDLSRKKSTQHVE